jgi:hypothetical protein
VPNRNYDDVSRFLNVLEFGVTQGALANNTARGVNRTNFNTAISTAVSQGKILIVPPGDYEIHGGGLLVTSSYFRWLGSTSSRIIQHQLNAPVLHLGPALGVTAQTIEGAVIDGAYLRYAGTATVGGNALEMNGAYLCRVGNLQIGDVNQGASGATSVPYIGVYCDQLPGVTPCFSNTFHDVRIKNFVKYGWSQFRDDYAAATGNHYSNLYISSGGGGDRRDITAVGGIPLYMGALAQSVFNQLNIEWSTCETAMHLEVARDVVFNSVNIEGIVLKRASSGDAGMINWYYGSGAVHGLHVNNCDLTSTNNITNPSTLRLYDATVSVDASTPLLCTKSGIANYAYARGWSGSTASRIALSGLSLGDSDQLDLVDGGNLLFTQLSDFNNDTPLTLSDASVTHYAYGMRGVLLMAPSTARTVTLSRACSAAIAARIPAGTRRVIRKTGGAGNLLVANYEATTLATLSTTDSVTCVFDGTNWVVAA